MGMRLRSESTEVVGERLAGGRRFKLPKLWGGQRGQAAVTTTDGRQLLRVEEPKGSYENIQLFTYLIKHIFCVKSVFREHYLGQIRTQVYT